MIKRLFLYTGVFLSVSFCNSETKSNQKVKESSRIHQPENYFFPYALDKPDNEIKLPSYLEEISGLSYCPSEKIACVQDEKANIYVLDLTGKKDISKYDFGKDGDFEDIAIIDKTAWVLRNDGRIFRVKDFNKKKLKVKKYETALSEKNDTEGIAYDPRGNCLLIACKGSPNIDKEENHSGNRAIYRFDLETRELDNEPRYLINLDKLDNYKDESGFTKFSRQLAKKFRMVESETSFMPSGIAIHPLDGKIYLISSIGKLLLVMDREGKILDIQDLDPILHRQPEGICFSPSGELYISNEGKGGKGYILKFKPKIYD